MEKRQRFTAEFKRGALRLLRAADKTAPVLARELGILRNRLYKWARDPEQTGAQGFAGSGRPKASDDELSTLKREKARLKEEDETLRKRRCTSRES